MSEKVRILGISEHQGNKVAFLSENSLYQGGGGQPPDRGELVQDHQSVQLLDTVILDEGTGWVVPSISLLHPGEAELYPDKVFHYEMSQQHTAQHILSAWAEKLYGWKSDGFAIQEKLSKIEFLEGSEDPCCYQQLESRTLETIIADLPVHISETSDAGTLRKPVYHDLVRVVEIPGVDKCGCGGSHVASTGQIGAFSVMQIERKHKNSVRVWFAAGIRLGKIARSSIEWEIKLRKWLSGDVEERIHSLLKESETHIKIEKWFWKQLADLIPAGQRIVELRDLPVSQPAMQTFASLLAQKGVSSFLVNEDNYFVLGGEDAQEKLTVLKEQGASGGGKGMITGKLR